MPPDPSLSALGYSFFNWDGFDPPTFVGFQNFIDVVNDPEVQGSVPHLIVLTVLSVLITLTAPLFAASFRNDCTAITAAKRLESKRAAISARVPP